MFEGFWSNFAHISEILSSHKFIDIFAFTETHIMDEPGELFDLPGYTYINKPRTSGKGGGVCLYISDRLNWTRRNDLETVELESIWIEVFPHKSKSILICVMYRPPDSSSYVPKDFSNFLSTQLSSATKSNNELNINYLEAGNHFNIKTLLTILGLEQLIKQATRITKIHQR